MFVLWRWISLITMLEAPTLVACLNNVAMVRLRILVKMNIHFGKINTRFYDAFLVVFSTSCVHFDQYTH